MAEEIIELTRETYDHLWGVIVLLAHEREVHHDETAVIIREQLEVMGVENAYHRASAIALAVKERRRLPRPCEPGCEWEPGHRAEHPCGARVLPEDP